MSESEEFLDACSERCKIELGSTTNFIGNQSVFSIEGPNSVTDDSESEEFYDVIEEPAAKEEPSRILNDNKPENSTEKLPPKMVSPPLSHYKNSKHLSILEFLQEEPEESVAEEQKPADFLDKRETIYEFLASDEDEEIRKESESSLSRLQSELADSPAHENLRKSILNLPTANHQQQQPPPFPHKRDSILKRANPLATFFTDQAPHDISDSDSMISELTEAMTIRTDQSDLRLSRHGSTLLPAGIDSLKLAKRYKPVPVKTKSKQKSEFGSLFLIQELNRASNDDNNLNRSNSARSDESAAVKDPSKAIFVLKFSPDGHFLASAGSEGVIKIWSLHQPDPDTPPLRLATIFDSEPIQILKGHTAEILDCAWSTNNFLLTASMDKTVRLWHHTRSDALGIFQHLDYVTSVAFHPRDPRIFLSGSLDCKLRLWSIQDRTILHWNELPPGNFITAVAFTRSGSTAIAGTSGGTALIFDTEGLRYNTQILVRSSRSKSFGKKITSIESVPGQYDNDERILISSNDSRIRMYSLRDKNVIYKYKGHENFSSQIGASLSTEADFILSGSEDCRVYLWRCDGKFEKKSFFSSFRKDHISSYESFKAHSNPVTAAIIAPNCVTNLLQSLQLRPLNPLHSTEGKIIITVDVTGQIKVFETNSKLIEWLK